MLQSLCRFGLTAVLFGLLFAPTAALAQDKRIRHVQDDAHLFSKEAIAQANATIAKIKERHKKDLFIETVAEGPEKDFPGWAKERFNNAAVDGVYIVLSKKPKKFQIDVGNETLKQGLFTRADIKELETIVKAKMSNDEVLNKLATFTLETFNEHNKGKPPVVPPKDKVAPGKRAQPPPVVHEPAAQHNQESAMPPWVGWVCMIVAVLFVVWIIFAVVRAMTGAMGGGYGGGGYGGYGGGGGGFLTGMLGGMFGAMAGMWMYNNFFGGHASMGQNGAVNWGGNDAGAGGAEAPYQGDTDVGASGGGDYGGGDDNAAGGDAGGDDDAGGGEWGGGDDAGGGDVGGGDAGGGDWGGGGGGDVGGGDWGGGGGGGDWGGGGGGDFGGGGGGDW